MNDQPISTKAWLLQNERAITCLANHPKYALRVVSNLYRIKTEDLQAWLDKYNDGARELTLARLHEIKVELGILSETRAEPAPVQRTASILTMASDLPKTTQPAAPRVTPWLARPRSPRAGTIKEYRKLLEKIASGAEVEVSHAEGQFLRKWCGSAKPSAATVTDFLSWIDAGSQKPEAEETKLEPAPKKKKLPTGFYPRPVPPPPPPLTVPAPAQVVGLRPRWLVDEDRLDEIAAAMLRYIKAGIPVPDAWILELTDLLEAAKRRRQEVPAVAGGAA